MESQSLWFASKFALLLTSPVADEDTGIYLVTHSITPDLLPGICVVHFGLLLSAWLMNDLLWKACLNHVALHYNCSLSKMITQNLLFALFYAMLITASIGDINVCLHLLLIGAY